MAMIINMSVMTREACGAAGALGEGRSSEHSLGESEKKDFFWRRGRLARGLRDRYKG